MFNDIMDANVSVHPDIEKAAVEWVEYELNRIYGKKTSIYVPSLVGEAERMLTDRLGKKWKKNHKITIDIGKNGNEEREIKVKLKWWD